jgi:hypothetical protein
MTNGKLSVENKFAGLSERAAIGTRADSNSQAINFGNSAVVDSGDHFVGNPCLPFIDLDLLEGHFDQAQIRSMNRASYPFRCFAKGLYKDCGEPDCGPTTGVYLLASDGPRTKKYYDIVSAPNAWRDPFELYRKFPAKQAIGAPSSMAAAQVAIEFKASGPILCMHPTPVAWNILLEELEFDFNDGRIVQAVVGIGIALTESVAPIRDAQAYQKEVCWLAVVPRWDAEIQRNLQLRGSWAFNASGGKNES